MPNLDRRPCDGGFPCATATVPLDYARPTGPAIDLAVIKRPATGIVGTAPGRHRSRD